MTTKTSFYTEATAPKSTQITQQEFNAALKNALEHMRDVSVRDGVQSWDANKWPISSVLAVLQEINTYAKLAKKFNITIPPVETWGGGQVAQPAKFLYEDPLVNLQDMAAVAPDIRMQCLYRGRQAFGFRPVSEEVQQKALHAAIARGIKVVRIFDMMNDIENVKPGIKIIQNYNSNHPDSPVIAEGAISYISEPEGKPRVWNHEDYAQYAVALAKLGCQEIVIKNYAGVGDREMAPLVKAIHAALNAKGLDRPVNLHTHGAKAEVLAEAVAAGASKVDVAFGTLSDGPSHSNAMKLLKLLLLQNNIDVEGNAKAMFDHHPLVRQMRKIETVVNREAAQFKQRVKDLPQADLERYRMAGGALADAWGRLNSPVGDAKINEAMAALINPVLVAKGEAAAAVGDGVTGYQSDVLKWIRAKVPAERIPKKEEYRKLILEQGPELWEQAGRFNTVTPGAFILTNQAITLAFKKILGEPVLMTDYNQAYLDVVVGRYGENKGAEKLPHCREFRNAVMAFRLLKKTNAMVENGVITPEQSIQLISKLLKRAPETLAPMLYAEGGKRGTLNLEDASLQRRLQSANLEEARPLIEAFTISQNEKQALLDELVPHRFAPPTETLETGKEILEQINTTPDLLLASNKRISESPEDLHLLAVLLRAPTPNGGISDAIFSNMLNKASSRQAAPASPGWRHP